MQKSEVSIVHIASGKVLAKGPKGWGITPFEDNYYVSGQWIDKSLFRNNWIPGLCAYKGLYHWLDLQLPDGIRIKSLAWRYWLPNPLFPFIWFRIAIPADHPEIRIEIK